jgi:hypothetical protein
MTKSAKPLRTAVSAAKGLTFAALILPLAAASASALANGIQMLPPVTEATKANTIATTNSVPAPCPPGGSPSVLTWDGTNPISCATGVTVTGGNVGIGTTAPATLLDIEGGQGNLVQVEGTTGEFYLNPSNGIISESGEIGLRSGGGNDILSLQSANGTDRLYIPGSTGYVGIGTTGPIGNLDVEPTPAQVVTTPPTPATICLNGTCSTTHGFGSYVQRYGTATKTIKEPCGFTSVAYCPSGYTAISGGMTDGGNVELQDSQPVFNASGKPNGWFISVVDGNGGGFCSNNTIPDGTTADGTPPNLSFTGVSVMYGDAVVLCGQD